jgi:hypothetical protein
MLPLIGAGLGIASGILGAGAERRKQEAQGTMKAAEMSAQPWTKQAPTTEIQFASPLAGKILGGAGAGLSLGQSLSNAGATSPWASMGQAAPTPQAQAISEMQPVQNQFSNAQNDIYGGVLDKMRQNPSIYSAQA